MLQLSKNQFTQLLKEEIRQAVKEAMADRMTADGSHFRSVLEPLVRELNAMAKDEARGIDLPLSRLKDPKLYNKARKRVEEFVNKTGLDKEDKEHIIGIAQSKKDFPSLLSYANNSLLTYEGLGKEKKKEDKGPKKK